MPSLGYILLAVSLWSIASGALQKVLLIMRHGDRTTSNPSFPTELKTVFSNGAGDITELGRTEGYELGKRLRTMYQTFLTNNTNEVRANSSDYTRCIITTGCALIGMYTPDDKGTCMNATGADGWPVTVNFIPVNKELVLNSDNCQQFQAEKQSPETLKENSDYLHQYNGTIEELANYTGYKNISTASVFFKTYDNLLVEKIHNLTSQYGWVDPMWPDIQAAAYPAYYVEYTTNASRKLAGGPILNEIVQRVKDGNSTTKLHIYGTHDTIISPLLLLLDVDNGYPAPYTATVIVELHDNATVRMMYINSTDPPLSLQIPECNMFCPVEQFVNLTSSLVVTDPVQECSPGGKNGKNGNDKFTSSTISVFCCLLVALFLS